MNEWQKQDAERAAKEAEALAWRESLKEGDEVYVRRSSMWGSGFLSRVTRRTAKQVILTTQRFNVQTGRETPGGRRPARIEPITQEIREKIEEGQLRDWLYEARDLVTLDQLRAMRKAYDEAAPK